MLNSSCEYTINSSNQLKIKEFKKYLPGHVHVIQQDLKEPLGDPITIICYKASQFDNVLVDDCSLEIEGAMVGPMIKWHLEKLESYINRKASFICLLAIYKNRKIYIYKGQVDGKIVESRGKKYGFLSYFQPKGSNQTLAEELPDKYNARFYAIQNFLNEKVHTVCEPLHIWQGLFQGEDS